MAEIRNTIYAYAVHNSTPRVSPPSHPTSPRTHWRFRTQWRAMAHWRSRAHWRTRGSLCLTQVCRQIRKEFLLLYWKENQTSYPIPTLKSYLLAAFQDIPSATAVMERYTATLAVNCRCTNIDQRPHIRRRTCHSQYNTLSSEYFFYEYNRPILAPSTDISPLLKFVATSTLVNFEKPDWTTTKSGYWDAECTALGTTVGTCSGRSQSEY